MLSKLMAFAINRPKIILFSVAILVVIALSQFPRITVDTDPENMLPQDAPARVFHAEMKKEFGLYDLIVIGVVNRDDSNGVFNITTLANVYNITEEIRVLDGVISSEVIALSTKDNIQQAGMGAVRFNWLMEELPKTQKDAFLIRDEALDHPMFYGTLVSEDGKALALYIPIEKKDISYEVTQKIKEVINRYPGDEEYHFTGLPIANDQFGAEMFKQMAVSAPLAGLVIFLLMWIFFKSIRLIIAPMLVAMATVVIAMGLLIGFRFPVHIMSSMIPIFLMPIAVLDSIHILSEFFDKYHLFGDRKKTIKHVLKELFSPMLFTSLTSAVGFFSLSFSRIPPVQVFGVFVAIGVLVAWILTILFIPAYIMLMDAKHFEKFGLSGKKEKSVVLDKILATVKTVSTKHFKAVLTVTAILVVLSIYGISLIQVNDNPVRWFNKSHPIRVADRILNKHFAGTYEAYLVLEAKDKEAEAFINPEMIK